MDLSGSARETRGGPKLAPLGPSVLSALPERVRRALPGWQGVLVWGDAVGPEAARRSRAVAYREGRLIVEVASSVWMQHLAAVKRTLVNRVNQAIGVPAVEDIVFVLNPVLAGPPLALPPAAGPPPKA